MHNYRDHFACFRCRKAFKYWQWEDSDESEWKMRARLEHVPREIVCPDCSRPMIDMGLDFKAPSKDDREAWQILEMLQHYGFAFHGCGCDAGGFVPPQRLREVPAWLEAHRHLSEGESLAKRFAAKANNA
ncbi:hypothetical protein [Aquisphaera insulae]|uniref:hypothetical protein n=1 Tax=Aquisphaera insulae TaxID=2712864 RepID=UPI0013EAB6E7|nr:hypothetical protein [Aquisphaera insulae]